MLSTAVCRTCDCIKSNNLNKLNSVVEYPEKKLSLSDMLLELAIIERNMVSKKRLPQELCSTCTRKLKGAYKFVMQAKENEQKLLARLKNSMDIKIQDVHNTDCLQETPMDLYAEGFLEIKMEEGVCDNPHNSDICNAEMQKELEIEPDTKSENKSSFDPLSKHESSLKNSTSVDELYNLPLKQRKKESEKTLKRKKVSTERKYECEKCDKSYLWPQNLRIHKRTHISKEDLFICEQCSQEFSRKESYKVHLKKHGEQNSNKRPANLCERKQAKDIDNNMCKPNGCKLIQCMICLAKCSNFVELRSHMQGHQENVYFNDRTERLRNIVDSSYPELKNTAVEDLVARIQKDLKAEKYSLFYSITNESGYELSLDSSETESELDLDADETPKYVTKAGKCKSTYNCELCTARYHRKYQLFEHQKEQHAWLEAPHACSRCDARFVSVKLLEHHYKSQCKNSQKRLICRKCPLRFRWKHNLKYHYRDHKINNETYECTECVRSFDNKKSLSIHMLTVHIDQSNLLPCHWCDRKFYRRDYLIKHLKRHGFKEQDLPLAETYIAATTKSNGIKFIKCKVCNINFDRIVDLRNHLQLEVKLALSMHHSYNSLSNYSITNASGFELHIEDSETGEDEDVYTSNQKLHGFYTCELCQVQCRRKFELMQHQRTIHRFEVMPYSCDKCIFKTVSKDLFDYHKNTQCFNIEKKHACEICGYKFMWLENLEIHKNLQHSNAIDVLSTPVKQTNVDTKSDANETSTISLPTLQCPHCDRTYILQSRLNNHIRDVHVDGDRKKKEAQQNFLCSLCGKELCSAANLVTHMRRHTGEKPFKCDLCEMAFPRHCEMLGHRRKHTGERPYHCTVCGKNFSHSHKLKRHMLTHSGLKPYKCTYCEKCYRQSKDLAIHMQQHTGDCPYACGTCGERFLQSSTLEKHRMMRRHFDESR